MDGVCDGVTGCTSGGMCVGTHCCAGDTGPSSMECASSLVYGEGVLSVLLLVALLHLTDLLRETGTVTLARLPVELVATGVVSTCSSGKGCIAQGSCLSSSSTTCLLSLLPGIDRTSSL